MLYFSLRRYVRFIEKPIALRLFENALIQVASPFRKPYKYQSKASGTSHASSMVLVRLENAARITCQASDRYISKRLQKPFDKGVPEL